MHYGWAMCSHCFCGENKTIEVGNDGKDVENNVIDASMAVCDIINEGDESESISIHECSNWVSMYVETVTKCIA